MADIYDVNGNIIEVATEITDADINRAFTKALADGTIKIGSVIGNTLGIASDAQFNKAYTDTAYTNLLNAYKLYPNSVPFFIHSDQHGRGVEIQRYVNNIDIDGIEMANINGGDTVVDTFGATVLENIYQSIKYVKNYIGIPGNHDYKPASETVQPFTIRKAFGTTNLIRRMIITSNLDCYVAYYPLHTVKFICIDPYDSRGIVGGMASPYFNTEVVDWLITELGRNDGFDIVVLMHEPQFVTYKHRSDSSYSTWSGNHSLYDLLVARKNKTSGTYVDSENVSHSFDFSNVQNNLLCMLSGHWHDEVYSDNDGLTVYAQDWAGANKFGGSFGLIDRDNNLLRIFSFDNVSGVKTELDITLQ